jgi:dTDP-4-amino-4,6-dideoxygalactose transaminase
VKEEIVGTLSAKAESRLAVAGGGPVRAAPFAPWPYFELSDIEAAASVLRSGRINYWTGQEGRLFEQEFTAFTRSKYAIAVANGTVALELALYALGIGTGDEVVVPSRSFVASASCAVMRGATPVFADIDRDSQNLTAETIRPVLSPRTKAIIAVHLAGWPCDLDPILGLARERRIKVIEDCAQAAGASYKGRPVGSLGDAAAFSFCQDKIISTGGEGGMLLTNDHEVWERAWSYKDHGKDYRAAHEPRGSLEFRWLHHSFGTNWRLTEMQSALGRVLLRRLPGYVEKRRRNAALLTEGFSKIPGLRLSPPPPEAGHAYYKYYVFLRPKELAEGWDRSHVLAAINAEGIPCSVGSCSEIYLEKSFANGLYPPERLPVARELGETSLMFLVHPTLWPEDMQDTCQAVEKVMRVATSRDRT